MKLLLVFVVLFNYTTFAVKLGCIEGIMGSGKTTLLSQIPPKIKIGDQLISIYKVEEPYTQLKESQMLDVYSKNYETHNLHMQLAIHSGLLAQFIQIQHTQRRHNFIIFDRCPETALDVYARTSQLSASEKELITAYKAFIYTYLSTWKDFDFRIYLNITAQTAFTRIQLRNRSIEEKTIPVSYYQLLLDLFENWAGNSHIMYENSLEELKKILILY